MKNLDQSEILQARTDLVTNLTRKSCALDLVDITCRNKFGRSDDDSDDKAASSPRVPSGSGLLAGIVKMTLKASKHFEQACGTCGLEMLPTFAGGDFDAKGTMV